MGVSREQDVCGTFCSVRVCSYVVDSCVLVWVCGSLSLLAFLFNLNFIQPVVNIIFYVQVFCWVLCQCCCCGCIFWFILLFCCFCLVFVCLFVFLFFLCFCFCFYFLLRKKAKKKSMVVKINTKYKIQNIEYENSFPTVW